MLRLCNFSGSHTMASKLHSSPPAECVHSLLKAAPVNGNDDWHFAAIFSPPGIVVADQTLASSQHQH